MKTSTLIKGFISLVVSGVILGLLIGFGINSFEFKGWEKIEPISLPRPLAFSAVAYNKNSDYAILFGGAYIDENSQYIKSSETWKWDSTKWEQIPTNNVPPAREKHAMAYDEERDVIVMFGGSTNDVVFNDTWEWNGKDWVEIKPAHVPTIRCCHTMAFDPIRKGVILYAGWNGKDLFWDDSWIWDGKDWTKLPYTSPQMSGHALVQYPPDNNLISIQASNQGTWSLSADGWQNLNISSPPSRSDGRGDYGEGKIIYFGGSVNSTPLNDTWVFTSGSWFNLQLPSIPPARYGHVLFYDEKRESFVMFGGADLSQIFNDTWEFELPNNISEFVIESTP